MRGILWTNLEGGGASGLKKKEVGALGVLMGCGFFRNSWKPFDSFHRVSFGFMFLSINVTAMKISSV